MLTITNDWIMRKRQAVRNHLQTGNMFCMGSTSEDADCVKMKAAGTGNPVVSNAEKPPVNPLRADPTRMYLIRRRLDAEIRRRFKNLLDDLRKLIVEDDSFGLKETKTLNVFCPTGPGGGVNPHCSPKGGSEADVAKAASGDGNAMFRVIDANRGMVHSIVRKYAKPGTQDYDDLVQEGYIGIMDAVQTYDPNKGAAFSTHAMWRIRGRVSAAARKTYKTRKREISTDYQEEEGKPGTVHPVAKPTKESRDADLSSALKQLSPREREIVERSWGVGGKEYSTAEEIGASLGIGKQRVGQIEKRAREKMQKYLISQDSTANVLADSMPVVNVPYRFRFATSAEQIAAFQEWLSQRMHYLILGTTMEQIERGWWTQYVEEGYRKGAGRAFDDVKKPVHQPDTWSERLPWYEGTRREFLQSAFGRAVRVETVKLLAGRVFTELRGITEDMSRSITRDLTDGLVQGKSAWSIYKKMAEDAGISEKRAMLIARTELTRVHAEGQLDAMDEMGVEEVHAMVEWSTAGDLRVCPMCRPLEGAIFKLREAKGLIPRHPNCRCAWLPANIGEDRSGTKVDWQKAAIKPVTTKRGIDLAIDASLKAEGRGQKTTWPGADADISKTRPKSIVNAFCATGKGGGIDPTCSPGRRGTKTGFVPLDLQKRFTKEERKEYTTLAKERKELNIKIKSGTATQEDQDRLAAVTEKLSQMRIMGRSRPDPTAPTKPPVEITTPTDVKKPPETPKTTKKGPQKMYKTVRDRLADEKDLDAIISTIKQHVYNDKTYTDRENDIQNLQKKIDDLRAERARVHTHSDRMPQIRSEIYRAQERLLEQKRQLADHEQVLSMQIRDLISLPDADRHPNAGIVRSQRSTMIDVSYSTNERAMSVIRPIPKLDKNVSDVSQAVEKMVHKDAGGGDIKGVVHVSPAQSVRAYHMDGFGIVIAEGSKQSSIAHEYGHELEEKLPGVRKACQDFAKERIAASGKPDVSMAERFPNRGYKASEKGNDDTWQDLFDNESSAYYIGKKYPSGHTEVLSMGLQLLYSNPGRLAIRDPEYFKFMLVALRGGFNPNAPAKGPKQPPNSVKIPKMIPVPPTIQSKTNAGVQKRLDALHQLALKNDIDAIKSFKTNPDAKQTYARMVHRYKTEILRSLESEGDE